MNELKVMLVAGALLAACLPTAHSQALPGAPAVVTVDNFIRAETDRYFALTIERAGLGRFFHWRALIPAGAKTVVRPNRDTLYSTAVFDLDAGPVTLSLPEAGKRYLSLALINEDHHVVGVYYGAGEHTVSREQIGTRYVMLGVRLLVDPADPADLSQVHGLQDSIAVSQPGGPGRFEVPDWDETSRARMRGALSVLGQSLSDSRGMFGKPGEVDPVRHLIGSAMAWGGNPQQDAYYQIVTPARNDGVTPYRLNIGEVPVQGFWSISVYDADGHYRPNPQEAYTLNNLTAKKGEGGRVSVQFGDCTAATVNCLPITPGWNYMVRFYLPEPPVLDGRWTLPEAKPAS
ncbi:DUF1254 domain-containing protein [Pseudomonas alkylphenolica]|uniref:DUF1254 domain-containing protein n=1 Tax=Pseudomonas alkylphenolica TaxID=237609 RepID=UPI0018D86B66|nr:DUF1254 domain-containing protein [Pseudomonas alkylphenolica]MBH3429666.1 DUF1254 domain-containing protein [Pseudomonas alkylphenolica]